ncbi:MAG: hypothetical protein Q8S33_13675 [Myxococcales bacterium]|nr:hypothetical protein [Myxococcales bacterium]
MKKLLVLLGLARCATPGTLGMSESCGRLYDACLSTCVGGTGTNQPNPSFQSDSSWQIDTAVCMNDCNERGRTCK